MKERAAISVWWLTTVMLAGTALLFVQVLAHPLPHAHPVVPWWILVAAFAATEAFVVVLRLRQGAHSISLSEIPLVVGLAFTAPVGLIAARVMGGAGILIVHRRQRGVKLGFNIAHFALEATVAVVVYRLVLGGSDPGAPQGWLAAFAATLLLDVLGAVSITAAISLHEGGFEWAGILATVVEGAGAAAANTSAALVAILVLERDVRAVWLLIVVVTVLQIAYRAYTAMGRSHSRMGLLYAFTSEIGRSVQADEVQRAILDQVSDALDSATAALVLLGEDNELILLSRTGDGTVVATREVFDSSVWWANAVDGMIVNVGRATRARGGDGPALGLKNGLAVPLRGENHVIGVLMVAGRRDDVTDFDPDDVRLLETLANHARVSLDNARLVDRLRQNVSEQEHEATHDHLTGLPNRRSFTAAVDEALEQLDARAIGVAVMLIDLDRFKEINDTLGHHIGDELLREVGTRLGASVGSRGSIARLGGDEFAVMLRDVSGLDQIMTIARDLVAVLEAPFALQNLAIDVRASVGVAVSPAHGNSSSMLLQRADVAMYDAKGDHAGIRLYDPARDQYSPRRLALASELRQSIESGELVVHYQPKIEISTGRLTGAEALVRWPHPSQGLIPPDDFIPLAESTGLIRPLTRFVLESALRQCAVWQAAGLAVGIAVNISARSLLDDALPAEVAMLLAVTGVEPGQLTLEITEGSIISDPARSLALLARLHASGIRLSIDDFGTGYSSLSYLKQLPVDELKIDKSFVTAMATDASDATIVRSTVDLAHNLGLTVVAEGVEARESLDLLAEINCETAQGYLIGRPMPADQFAAWAQSSSGFDLATTTTGRQTETRPRGTLSPLAALLP